MKTIMEAVANLFAKKMLAAVDTDLTTTHSTIFFYQPEKPQMKE